MARLALIWLTLVVAVNCKLFLKEDAQENKVVPVDTYGAPAVLHEENTSKLFKARDSHGQHLGKKKVQLFQHEEEKGRKRGRKSKNVRRKATRRNRNRANKRKNRNNPNERRKILTLNDFNSKDIDMDDLCKKTLELDVGTDFELLPPTKKKRCNGVSVKVNGRGTLSMTCSLFELNDGGCKRESLSIKRYGRQCKTDAPEISGADSLKLLYRTKSRASSEGFRCTIRASGATSGSGQICSNCGKADISVTRIVGGQDADKNEYPWMLLMIVKSDKGQTSCGASLITSFWILTAQHCIDGADPADISVAYGIHKYEDALTDTVTADKVILHPDYDSVTLDNDIALVRLEKPVPMNDDVLPVCLASSPPEEGKPAVVTGLGTLEYGTGNYPDTLQELEVNIVSNNDCSDSYGGDITDAMICAAKKNKDACSGDSGGPLVMKRGDIWEQVGIVSFGDGCADKKYPGVYARVDHFYDWITGKIKSCE